MKEKKGKRLVVLGAGESGIGTALLGIKQGFKVFVSDRGQISKENKEVLRRFEIEWEEEQHTIALILSADVVMKSPGIPDTTALVVQLREKYIPVISEIEFAYPFTDAMLIGVTGSNGKTTTTTLINHVLKGAGLESKAVGNIGKSFAEEVVNDEASHYVLELSSFQLDGIVNFKPHIAILTNITPDHLDRYGYDFNKYIASKFRIVKNQTASDYLIYDSDDVVITECIKKHPVQSKLLPFSLKNRVKEGAYLENENIIITVDNNKFIMPAADLALKGNHNVKNAMAAATVAQLLRIRKNTIRECLENFHGVEHRLEDVLKINNVQYINDSKATNVNAAFYALDAMKSSTVWIVGGVDKGNDYSELYPLINEKVKAIICLGVDNSKIINAFGNCVDNIVETQSMREAVQYAYKIAERNDNVLLSPACASFDLFKNYEDRGRQFKEAVREL